MSTILGIVSGVGLLFWAIFTSAGIAAFIDIPSVAIVFGGTLGALFTAYPLPTVLKVSRVLVQIFKQDIQTPTWVIAMMVRLSFKARQKSLLSLEEDMRSMDNRFIKQGLEMIIDGHPGDLIRDVLQTELDLVRIRHNAGANIFISASKYAPAFGMIGTLIGLVAMLKNMGGGGGMGNPMAGVGEGMAVALITTFYGSMLANLFLSPVAEKLKNRSEDEVLSTTIIIEGLIMIQSGINPRLVEKKLNSFLSPHLRAAHYDRVVQQSKGGGGGRATGGGAGGGRAAPPPRQAPKIKDADDFDDDF